jgi:hypothetical protein
MHVPTAICEGPFWGHGGAIAEHKQASCSGESAFQVETVCMRDPLRSDVTSSRVRSTQTSSELPQCCSPIMRPAETRSADRVEHGLTAPAGADPLDNQDGIPG